MENNNGEENGKIMKKMIVYMLIHMQVLILMKKIAKMN
jgi:hypothetical protein